MKKLTIEITEKDGNASFQLKVEGMHRYEVLGILKTASLLQERNILEKNI